MELAVVAYTCNPSVQEAEAEAGGLPAVNLEASLGCSVRRRWCETVVIPALWR